MYSSLTSEALVVLLVGTFLPLLYGNSKIQLLEALPPTVFHDDRLVISIPINLKGKDPGGAQVGFYGKTCKWPFRSHSTGWTPVVWCPRLGSPEAAPEKRSL